MAYRSVINLDVIQELDALTLLGNPDAVTGIPEEIGLSSEFNFLDVGGDVTAVAITNAGTGGSDGSYLNSPATGGSGTGLTLDITISGGVITGAIVNNPGEGYITGETVTVGVGSISGEVLTLTANPITQVLETTYGLFAGAGTSGFVPDPITATGKFLSDNGTWIAPGGGPILIDQQRLVTSADSIVAGTDFMILGDASSGSFNLTLPAASLGRYRFEVKKITSANQITIVPTGGDLIDNLGSFLLKNLDSIAVFSDGTSNYYII